MDADIALGVVWNADNHGGRPRHERRLALCLGSPEHRRRSPSRPSGVASLDFHQSHAQQYAQRSVLHF
jgi:hypothetical protein